MFIHDKQINRSLGESLLRWQCSSRPEKKNRARSRYYHAFQSGDGFQHLFRRFLSLFHTSMKSSIRFLVLLSVAILIRSSIAQALADTSLTETFSETGQRTVGDSLDGTMTDGSSGSWNATPNVLIGGESGKGYAVMKNNELFLGKVAILSEAKTIRLEAQVRVVPDGKNDSFVAIGFGNPPSFNITWLGGIVLRMHSSGNAELMIHPDNHDTLDANRADALVPIASLKRDGFRADDFIKLALFYDVSNNVVSAWVNDKAIVDGFKLSNKGFIPVTRFAGFSGWAQKPDVPTVKDFHLTVH
jgi:hypothetical protein